MVWDEETIRSLRDLWTLGLSTAEIGRRLGVSKNAIVGKAHRLDLEARPSPIRRDAAKPVNERPAAFLRMAGPTLPPLASAVVQSFVSQALTVPAFVAPTFVPPAFATTGFASTAMAGPVTVQLVTVRPVAVQPAAIQPSTVQPVAVQPVADHPGNAATAVVPPAVTASSNAEPSNVQPLRPAPVVAVRPPTPPTVQTPPAAPRPMMPSTPIQTRRSTPSCCWPIGEPGTKAFRFCDDNSLPGKPYCDEHARLAYVRIRDRKEDAA